MDLKSVERHQNGIVQFLIVVIMLILGAILFVATRRVESPPIQYLCLAALAACLYATVQHRRLQRQLHSLLATLTTREKVLERLGDKLREESTKSAEMGTRLDDLTRLYRAISEVNSVRDPEAVYDVVVRAATQLVKADTGSLMLIEGNGGVLGLRSAVGLPDHLVAGHVTRRVGEGVSGWVAQHAESVLLVGEADEDDRFRRPLHDTGINVSLCVPLIHAQTVVGVLNLGIREHAAPTAGDGDTRTLGASHKSMASIFAQHAAVAVLNSRLLERKTA